MPAGRACTWCLAYRHKQHNAAQGLFSNNVLTHLCNQPHTAYRRSDKHWTKPSRSVLHSWPWPALS